MLVDSVLTNFKGVRRGGRGYVALCPSHEDREASLGVGEGDDGRVLLHCFKGCDTKDVIDSAGLTWGDLFPPDLKGSKHRA